MRALLIHRYWPPSALLVGLALFADVAPASSPAARVTPLDTALGQCAWVTGPPCLLGAELQATCLMTATCPAGQKVVSGACEGFTSVAIGRTAPNLDRQAWSCAAARVFAIDKPNEISAQAFCCP